MIILEIEKKEEDKILHQKHESSQKFQKLKKISAREQGKWQTERKAHSKFIRIVSISILRITLINLKNFILAFLIRFVR